MTQAIGVLVDDSPGQRLFYVGADDDTRAAKILVQKFPSLAERTVQFGAPSGLVAAALELSEGDVKEWKLGEPITLATLLGPF